MISEENASAMPDCQSEVVYRIDLNDCLVFFNDQWDRFALENDGSHLTSDKINQRPIWDFIHDAETRHLHEMLLRRVRANHPIAKLPFRCDSPSLRRYMEMDIVPLVDGKIEYRCRVLKTQSRKPVPVISAHAQEGMPLLRVCSWCKKVDVGHNSWLEVEEAIGSLGLFSKAISPRISHTICDGCLGNYEDDD